MAAVASESAVTRVVTRTLKSSKMREGGGFIVRRPVGHEVDQIDPILMLDHMGPVSYKPGEAVGAPDHPHRGQITFSYILDGSMQHRDSSGAKGELGPGDAQYMVAGRGVVHAEMPSDKIMKEGGTVEGFQLWLNLPAKKKMMAPSYQDVPASRMTVVPLVAKASSPASGVGAGEVVDGGSAKVVLGSALGATGPIELEGPVTYVDLRLRPGHTVDIDVPEGQQGFVYAFRGRGTVGEGEGAAPVEEGVMAQLGGGGAAVRVSCPGPVATDKPLEVVPGDSAAPSEVPLDEAGLAVLLVTGAPIGEPVVKYGPFVMNTQEEIVQAMRDYHAGRLGGAIEGAEERARRTAEAKEAQRESGTWRAGEKEL